MESDDALITKYEYVAKMNSDDYAPSNYVSTFEEETLLEYVESFRRQFIQLFPSRQEALFLTPCNEYGVNKFVCSSIRPTLQRFITTWHYEECIKFVSSFLRFYPLKQPSQFPDLLVSNDILLKIRSGDCLDYSNLLCSLLRGSGYNAFIVYGMAKYHITQNDQRNDDISDKILESTAWPIDDNQENQAKELDDAHNGIPEYYQYKNSKKIVSESSQTYEEYLVEKEQKLKNEKLAEVKKLNAIQKKQTFDPLNGRRIHFWVLIKKSREITDNDFFVEPVSGKIYDIKDENLPFDRIESVWNDENLWVNVQNGTIQEMSFDIKDNKKWEFVLFDAASTPNKEEKQKEILTLPKSWQQPFFLSQQNIDYPLPANYKMTNYNKAKLEEWNRFFNEDGLVLKVTLFADNTQSIIEEIREIFMDRSDLLIHRVTKLEQNGQKKVYELFDIGRVSGMHTMINLGDEQRVTSFYPNARSDGMLKRVEVFGEKVVELFEDRNDGIVKRIIYLMNKVDDDKNVNKVNIHFAGDANRDFCINKVEEYYDESNDEKIRLLTYSIMSNEYIVNYHYGVNRILSKNCIFNKNSGEVRGWNPGQSELPNTCLLKEQFEALIVSEKNLLTEIRERERAFGLLLNKMSEERQNLKLKKDPHTISKQTKIEQNDEDNGDADEDEEVVDAVDETEADDEYSMLRSFLPTAQNEKGSLNKEQIDQIKEDCLRSLKERLVERLNIITRRLHKEIECLEEAKTKWENYQNTEIDADADNLTNYNEQILNEEKEAEYKAFKKESEFKIKIIKQRLERHERLSIQRMNKLSQMLDSYPNINRLKL